MVGTGEVALRSEIWHRGQGRRDVCRSLIRLGAIPMDHYWSPPQQQLLTWLKLQAARYHRR